MAPKLVILLLVSAAIVGCGDSGIGAAPVVQVSKQQHAQDLSAKAAKTVTWLEKLSPAERQAALDRVPQIKSDLKGATEPALKDRISKLGIQL